MYRLYIGFRKLGEFESIFEAKRFANKCRLAGTFNLIGENYHDSWYVLESEIRPKNTLTNTD